MVDGHLIAFTALSTISQNRFIVHVYIQVPAYDVILFRFALVINKPQAMSLTRLGPKPIKSNCTSDQ